MKCLTYVNVCRPKTQISQAVSADRVMNYVICKVKSILFPLDIQRVLQKTASHCCGRPGPVFSAVFYVGAEAGKDCSPTWH